jgi:hypothetical protein
VFWWILVAWLALRFALLGLAVTWQPLYPWDAWIQWATKARVWYELGRLAPFALPDAWFAANGAVYFDSAPHYPSTMPLLQVWANLALGRWDDALMNWPWWQIAVALTLAVYGGLCGSAHRRLRRSSARSSWPRCRWPMRMWHWPATRISRSPRITRSRH